MTNEEAIKNLELNWDSLIDTGLLDCETLCECNNALNKQTPQPTDKTMHDSEETHDRCPNCGAFVYGRFCADCGQKLDWEVVVSKTESTTKGVTE